MFQSLQGDIARTFKTVHTWVGITAGLFLFIAFYAGAITVFKGPLERWAAPAAAIGTAPQSWDQADRLISQTLAARPDAGKSFTLSLVDGPQGPMLRLVWSKSRTDPKPWVAQLDDSGTARISQTGQSGLGQFIDIIHRTAGIPGDLDIGVTVMGVISALYVVALISGLIMFLPTMAKDFLALRITPNLKRMWMDAHNLVGVASLPFHLVIALSAVVFGLHDVIYDSLDLAVYDGKLKAIMAEGNPFTAVKPDPTPATMLSPADLAERVRALSPDFQAHAMQYRDAGTMGASVRIMGSDPTHLVRGSAFAFVNPVTGQILNTEYLPGHQGIWSAIVSALFALHFASFGGDTIRWAYVILGLAGAFLFYSGNLLWIESRRRRAQGDAADDGQRRSVRMMAALTVGVCLGSVAGLSLAVAISKWLAGHPDLAQWRMGLYYAAFLGAVVWAFLRGAARAGSGLCWFAALSCLTIPLTSALGALLPTLAAWHPQNGLAVETLGLIMGLLFIHLARKTARRQQHGTQDSVWAAIRP